MMVIVDICASLYVGKKSSKDANLKELKWLFPFSLVGMILGIALLIQSPSEPLLIMGGTFTALFATGGPIYVSYLGLRINDPKVLRATMAFAIFMLTFLRLTLMLVTGLILSWSVIGLAVCLLPATFMGIWLGTHVHTKLSNASMRIAYGAILLFSGLMLLIKQI
jgi:uncharacterized protein